MWFKSEGSSCFTGTLIAAGPWSVSLKHLNLFQKWTHTHTLSPHLKSFSSFNREAQTLPLTHRYSCVCVWFRESRKWFDTLHISESVSMKDAHCVYTTHTQLFHHFRGLHTHFQKTQTKIKADILNSYEDIWVSERIYVPTLIGRQAHAHIFQGRLVQASDNHPSTTAPHMCVFVRTLCSRDLHGFADLVSGLESQQWATSQTQLCMCVCAAQEALVRIKV